MGFLALFILMKWKRQEIRKERFSQEPELIENELEEVEGI